MVTSSAQANTGVKRIVIMGGWHDWESQQGARQALRSNWKAGREAVSSERPRSPSRRGGNSFNSHHLRLSRIRPGIVRGPITALSTRIEGAVLNGWYDVIDRPTAVRQVDSRIFSALWNLGFDW